MTDINITVPEPASEPTEVVPVSVESAPVMSEADMADLTRLRAEETARQEAEAEETRRIAENAQFVAEEALRVASDVQVKAELAEVKAEEEPPYEEEPKEEHEPEPVEEDKVPNVDSAWFKPIGRK